MNDIRTVSRVVTGRNTVDGAGVRLVRVFGVHDTKDFDPFLMLDAFDSDNPDDYVKGFPWHPHRGIETVTYLVEGNIVHGDSLGNTGSILDGQCQWMTAGSGIIHQEMPQPSRRMLGVQLWLNLPSVHKMTVPKYRSILETDIPVVAENGGRVHVIAGNYCGSNGPADCDYIKALFLDVELDPGTVWSMETERENTLFAYILSGAAGFGLENDAPVHAGHAVLFGQGRQFLIRAAETGTRFLLLSGKPLKEPVAWGGPIVMNTQEELELAFRELEENTFIK